MFLIAVVLLLVAGPIRNLGPNKTHIQFASPNAPGAHGIRVKAVGADGLAKRVRPWINAHMEKASRDPDRALAAMESWAHQAAIMSLFIAAPLLALLFGFQRRFYFYDHLIFSMHSLAFQGLLLAVALVGGGWVMAAWLLLLLAPVHLFVHMRGTYGTGVVDTLLRMTILFVGSFLGFAVLMAVLVLIGLAAEN